MKVRILLLVLLSLPLFSRSAQADEDGEELAVALSHRYGMDHLDRIDALRFTFHVREGTTTVRRAWMWDIEGGNVSLVTGDKKPFRHTYSPGSMTTGKAALVALNRKVDAWFLSDRQWILLPQQIANDRRGEHTLDEDQPLPIPPGTSDCVTVEYMNSGDVYEIYYDADRVIRQTIFRKGASPEAATIVTWGDLARVGPILVALRHNNAKGESVVWFSGMEARLRGSRRWVKAVRAN